MSRTATIKRVTGETSIQLALSLEGGDFSADTGLGFFDHMLCALATHARFGFALSAKGDLQVDGHHTVEDTGIVLGQALAKALGNKAGIDRFGQARIPMDEALADVTLDMSGRPHLRWEIPKVQERVGDFDVCLAREFWRAVCLNAGMTLHVAAYGQNAHHVIEAVFKASGRALRAAVAVEGTAIPSTKGVI